jgi:hypothetical protein
MYAGGFSMVTKEAWHERVGAVCRVLEYTIRTTGSLQAVTCSSSSSSSSSAQRVAPATPSVSQSMVAAEEQTLQQHLQPEYGRLFGALQLSVDYLFKVREGMGAAALTHSACCSLEHGLEQRRLLFSLSTSFLKLCSVMPAETDGGLVGKVMAFAWDAGAMLSTQLQQGGYSLACIRAAVAPWMVLTGRFFVLTGAMLRHHMAGLAAALAELQAATDSNSIRSSSRDAVGSGGSSSGGNEGGARSSDNSQGSGVCDCVICACTAAGNRIVLGCTDIAAQAVLNLQGDLQACWLQGAASRCTGGKQFPNAAQQQKQQKQKQKQQQQQQQQQQQGVTVQLQVYHKHHLQLPGVPVAVAGGSATAAAAAAVTSKWLAAKQCICNLLPATPGVAPGVGHCMVAVGNAQPLPLTESPFNSSS